MSDAVTDNGGLYSPSGANPSGRHGEMPTNPLMAALHRTAPEEAEKRRNWLLGHADSSTPSAAPDPVALVDEIADLREKLLAAELRADEAENALPHLMELGQRTVDGLLGDARRRGREIIEASREQADAELGHQRDEVRREAKELDALRMAVAAEAMGLEQVRSELQRRISRSASELHRMAEHPMLLGGELPVEDLAIAAGALAASELPASPDVEGETSVGGTVSGETVAAPVLPAGDVELVRSKAAEAAFFAPAEPAAQVQVESPDALPADSPVGLVEASTTAPPSVDAQIEIATSADATLDVSDDEAPVATANTASRFADAWAADEDDSAAEAFDRFFSADVEYEPSREWILADDTNE